MKQDMILILDLGSEENAQLAREIRGLGVYSEIYPHDITVEELSALPNVKGIILNGGPNHIIDGVEIDASDAVYNSGIPVICANHKGSEPLPEAVEDRKSALKSYIFDVCGCDTNWNMENFMPIRLSLFADR